MNVSVGKRLRTLRELQGWTQAHLAQVAGVGYRTIRRIESGSTEPQLQTLMAFAAAFKIDVSQVVSGLALEDLVELAGACSCPCCGSPIVQRTFVDHEYGDCEMEIFECGRTQGWRERPCPKDPRFPSFEDYDLVCREENGTVLCSARGKTQEARAVELQHGIGESERDAVMWVKRSYVAARHGYEAAAEFVRRTAR